MKRHRSSMEPSKAALSVLLLLGVCAAGTSQAQKYTVTPLPTIPGYTSPTGVGMNNAGVVVGTVEDPEGNSHAVEWINGKPIYLVNNTFPGSFSSAVAVNNQGDVIGNMRDSESGVFETGPNVDTGQSLDLGISVAAVSDTNVIVGIDAGHPVIWDGVDLSERPNGGLPSTANAQSEFSQPLGINAAGVIVGIEFDDLPDGSSYPVAVRWQPDPVTHSLAATVEPLGGLGGISSGASAVNANGWVVGSATLGNKLTHAVLWEPTSRAFDLGTLHGKQSGANGINAQGDIVGEAQTTRGDYHAVLWTHKHFTAIDLNTEISPSLAKQITLTSASATNDRCMVLANGIDNKTGAQETFVLTLTDQSNCNQP
jgi:probable HAF family extracellular repeat protein